MRDDPLMVEAVFVEALDLPADERAAFVARRCDDAVLEERVHRLLRAHDQSVTGFLDPPTPPTRIGDGSRATEVLRPAAKLGRYAVLHVLGRGGMGIVYAAYDDELGRKVAVKQVRGDRARGDAALRLEVEAKALARLQHPNVVAVHDVGQANGELFIAMELVEGQPLSRWGPSHGVDEVLAVLLAAGKGLAHAHRQGILHRDFKPGNVLVDESGRARVADFGLATDARFAEHDATPMGTAGYMAPEVLAGRPASVASDVYAYCAALEKLVLARDGAPEWLRPLVERGLADEPHARWSSLDDLLSAIERELGVDPEQDPRLGRKHRRQVYALYVALVLVTTAIVVGSTRSDVGLKHLFYLSLVPPLGVAVIVAVFRRPMMATAFNRRGALSLLIVSVAIALQGPLLLSLGASLPSAFCAALLLIACFLFGSWVYDRAWPLVASACVCVAGACSVAVFPGVAVLLFSLVALAQLPFLYLHWASKGRPGS
jgi:eukaryotic-like serine/threonine-protein kinase